MRSLLRRLCQGRSHETRRNEEFFIIFYLFGGELNMFFLKFCTSKRYCQNFCPERGLTTSTSIDTNTRTIPHLNIVAWYFCYCLVHSFSTEFFEEHEAAAVSHQSVINKPKLVPLAGTYLLDSIKNFWLYVGFLKLRKQSFSPFSFLFDFGSLLFVPPVFHPPTHHIHHLQS